MRHKTTALFIVVYTCTYMRFIYTASFNSRMKSKVKCFKDEKKTGAVGLLGS